jgi:SMI1-KNR4 cell-wall
VGIMPGDMARFEDVIERFWDRERTYGVHPPLTNDAISAAEIALGVRLPPDYLRLMRVQNGGSVSDDYDAFPVDPPHTWPSGQVVDHVWIGALDGLGGPGQHMEVMHSDDRYDEDWEVPSKGMVLIGTPDGGHQWLALDYRACGPDGEPSVLWSDTEGPWERELAPTFRAFVEGLRPLASFPGALPTEEELDALRRRHRPWPVKLWDALRGR